MRFLDRVIQRLRIRAVLPHLPARVRLIDVGAHEGELFVALGERLITGFGVDPLANPKDAGNFTIRKGLFPETAPPEKNHWDAVTMLAVLEHIPPDVQARIAGQCHASLRDGGLVVVTVPSKVVDRILDVLRGLRLVDGMSLEEHYGFDPQETLQVFSAPRFRLVHHSRFELGLNHLYVFAKLGSSAQS